MCCHRVLRQSTKKIISDIDGTRAKGGFQAFIRFEAHSFQCPHHSLFEKRRWFRGEEPVILNSTTMHAHNSVKSGGSEFVHSVFLCNFPFNGNDDPIN